MGLSFDTKLNHAPSPPDNPLMGLVPYAATDPGDRFPHSLQFAYFAFSDLMIGSNEYDWSKFDEVLNTVASRGCQLVTRVYLEYPGKKGVPQFLIDGGLKVTEWQTDGLASYTPDYENPSLRKALSDFIAAFGARYDDDPRLGYLTAGILGLWGEWHTYPKVELFASKTVQDEVLQALDKAFDNTPVLLRYPAGENHYEKSQNSQYRFGYHDDSFAWATLDTGKEEDHWFFIPLMKAAGTLDHWKAQPIGGEIRPELWDTCFTDKPHPKTQNFAKCVDQTHVTWLMDSGVFDPRFSLSPERKKRAIEEVRRMGYSFHVPGWSYTDGGIEVTIENRGVAPFYRDWPLVVSALREGQDIWQETTDSSLKDLLPGQSKTVKIAIPDDKKGSSIRLAIPNLMDGGKAVKFANETQGELWLTLGDYQPKS